MMSFDSTKDLLTPLRKIHLANKGSPQITLKEVLGFLENLLKRGLDDEDLQFVYAELAFAHYRYGRAVDAEPVILAATNRFPTSPLSWIAASKYYSFWTDPPLDLDKAKQLAMQAVDVARTSGTFVVHSLNELCRVGRVAEDYRMMEQGIKALLHHPQIQGAMDSAYECDFLVNLPPGALDEALIDGLRARCLKRPG